MEFSIVPSSESSKEIETGEFSGITEIPEEEIWLASKKVCRPDERIKMTFWIFCSAAKSPTLTSFEKSPIGK